jgi:sugar phosphate isomerase/epimerase
LPDYAQPDPLRRQKKIDQEKRTIEITAFFGGRFCRFLSDHRRPELAREDGVEQVVGGTKERLPLAEDHGVALSMENHYKDNC